MALQEGDDPETWAALTHQLRITPDHRNALKLPLHLAQLIGEYVLHAEDDRPLSSPAAPAGPRAGRGGQADRHALGLLLWWALRWWAAVCRPVGREGRPATMLAMLSKTSWAGRCRRRSRMRERRSLREPGG